MLVKVLQELRNVNGVTLCCVLGCVAPLSSPAQEATCAGCTQGPLFAVMSPASQQTQVSFLLGFGVLACGQCANSQVKCIWLWCMLASQQTLKQLRRAWLAALLAEQRRKHIMDVGCCDFFGKHILQVI